MRVSDRRLPWEQIVLRATPPVSLWGSGPRRAATHVGSGALSFQRPVPAVTLRGQGLSWRQGSRPGAVAFLEAEPDGWAAPACR